jgi:ATP-dependent Lhr-like helicase
VTPTDEADLFIGLSEQPGAEAAELTAAFRDPQARYTFDRIRDAYPLGLAEFNRLWWQAVWAGLIAADEWKVLRDAARRRYELGDVSAAGGAGRSLRPRPRFAPIGWSGNWYVIPRPETPSPLQALEIDRQTVRILLDRYGVLCRELVVREGLSWSGCFRALRIMELAGEVSGGLFFEGLSGPQFATSTAAHRLHPVSADRHWWVNATDPASPCGLGLDWPGLPRRMAGNWLSFHGSELILVVEQGGKSLRFDVGPGDPRLAPSLQLVRHLVATRGRLALVQINRLPVIDSPYLGLLETHFALYRDHRTVELGLP